MGEYAAVVTAPALPLEGTEPALEARLLPVPIQVPISLPVTAVAVVATPGTAVQLRGSPPCALLLSVCAKRHALPCPMLCDCVYHDPLPSLVACAYAVLDSAPHAPGECGVVIDAVPAPEGPVPAPVAAPAPPRFQLTCVAMVPSGEGVSGSWEVDFHWDAGLHAHVHPPAATPSAGEASALSQTA